MRPLFFVAVSAGTTATLLAACSSDSSSNGGFTFEAGQYDSPTIDAGPSVDAGNVAIAVPALGSGFDYYQGSYSLGWTFTANAAIRVKALGFYDDLKNGLTESHPVAIYDKTTQAVLAQTTVGPSDPLDGFFRYHTLDAPLTLTKDTAYVVLTVVGKEKYVAFGDIDPGWTVTPNITFTGAAVNYANAQTTTLLWPDTFGPKGGDHGPNFTFEGP